MSLKYSSVHTIDGIDLILNTQLLENVLANMKYKSREGTLLGR